MPESRGRLARSGAVLAAATLAANVLGYVLVLALSRLLPPADYGAMGALLNLAVIGTVPALTVQLVAARATARSPSRRPDPRLGALGLTAGAAVGAAVVAAAPLLDRYLHLGGPWAAVCLGASLVPAAGTAAAHGALQGAERFGPLALLLATAGATRCAGAVAAAATGFGVTGAVAGILVGNLVSLAVAVAVVPGAFRSPGAPPGLWREVLVSSTSTAGLLTFVNLDVLLARHSLAAAASGVYAVGSIFTKVTFWGPAFLATLLYPRMAAPEGRHRAVAAAVGLTTALGGAVVVLAGAVGAPLVALAAGERYAPLGRTVALFAALGTAFAVVQVLVYARMAVGDRLLGAASWLLAGATAAAVGLAHPATVGGLVTTVLAGALGLVLLGLVREPAAVRALLRAPRGERPAGPTATPLSGRPRARTSRSPR